MEKVLTLSDKSDCYNFHIFQVWGPWWRRLLTRLKFWRRRARLRISGDAGYYVVTGIDYEKGEIVMQPAKWWL